MPTRGSLASYLSSAARQVEKRQLAHFRTAVGDQAGELLVPAVQEMTRGILRSGHEMVWEPRDDVAGRLMRQLLEDRGPPRRLAAHVELEIAKAFTLATDEMAQRCFELARLALPKPPGEAVARYLQRLGRCYVAGFFPECIVICRAVLEKALLERFERERKPLPPVPPGKSEMLARLSKAVDLGWLSRQQLNDGRTVNERGNKAVHEGPHMVADALDTIRLTLGLLRALYA